MTATLRKWHAVFGIYFQEGLAYRASGLIWIMTDLVTAVTMPLVWAKASSAGVGIAGFSTGDFVLYYLCMLMLGSFITSHIMWDLAMEIKEGQFSVMLVRPMSFFQITFLRNLSWRIIRSSLFLPIFIVLLFAYRGYLHGASVNLSWQFFAAVILGHFVSFTLVLMMSMFALLVEEVFSIFELYYFPMLFLSGQLFPIAVFPDWVRTIAQFLPFYYTTGAPTEILIGRTPESAIPQILGIQLLWVVLAYLGARALWKVGLKHYTGVGM